MLIIRSYKKETGNGIPLGNLTSQLFANVYLDPLDKFVKHKIKAKYYLRYADPKNKKVFAGEIADIRFYQVAIPPELCLKEYQSVKTQLGDLELKRTEMAATRDKLKKAFAELNDLNEALGEEDVAA